MSEGESVQTWLEAAEARAAEQRPDLARAAARMALVAGPRTPDDWRRLAQVYRRLSQDRIALAILRQGSLSTGAPEAFWAWAEELERTGDEAGGRIALRLAVGRSPDDVGLRVHLAEILLRARQPESARTELERALPQAPAHPRVLSLWAAVHEALGQPEVAAEALTTLLQHDDVPRRVVVRLAEHRCTLGDFSAAMDLLERQATDLADEPTYHVVLGRARRGAGYAEAALSSLRNAIRLDPNHAEAHLQLGQTFLELGRYEDALVALDAARKLEPDRAEVHRCVGEAELARGRQEPALRAFLKAASLVPDDETLRNRVASIMNETMPPQRAGSITADLQTMGVPETLEKLRRREADGVLEIESEDGDSVRLVLRAGRLVATEPLPSDAPYPTLSERGDSNRPPPPSPMEVAIVDALSRALQWTAGRLRFQPQETRSDWTGLNPTLALAKAARRGLAEEGA